MGKHQNSEYIKNSWNNKTVNPSRKRDEENRKALHKSRNLKWPINLGKAAQPYQ